MQQDSDQGYSEVLPREDQDQADLQGVPRRAGGEQVPHLEHPQEHQGPEQPLLYAEAAAELPVVARTRVFYATQRHPEPGHKDNHSGTELGHQQSQGQEECRQETAVDGNVRALEEGLRVHLREQPQAGLRHGEVREQVISDRSAGVLHKDQEGETADIPGQLLQTDEALSEVRPDRVDGFLPAGDVLQEDRDQQGDPGRVHQEELHAQTAAAERGGRTQLLPEETQPAPAASGAILRTALLLRLREQPAAGDAPVGGAGEEGAQGVL